MIYSRTLHESVGRTKRLRLKFCEIAFHCWLRREYIGIKREESLRFIASLWDGTRAFADIIIIFIGVIAVCMISKHYVENLGVLGCGRLTGRK